MDTRHHFLALVLAALTINCGTVLFLFPKQIKTCFSVYQILQSKAEPSLYFTRREMKTVKLINISLQIAMY